MPHAVRFAPALLATVVATAVAAAGQPAPRFAAFGESARFT
jgi:hypothetical protein